MRRIVLNLSSRLGTSSTIISSLYFYLKVNIRTKTNDITSPSKPSFKRPLITTSQSLPSVTRPLPSLNASKSHTERQSSSPSVSSKRSFAEFIDLTGDDEDPPQAEPNQRKKSRSLSNEVKTKQSDTKSGKFHFPFPLPLKSYSFNAAYNIQP